MSSTLYGLKSGSRYKGRNAGGVGDPALLECVFASVENVVLRFVGTPYYVHLTKFSDVEVERDLVTFGGDVITFN